LTFYLCIVTYVNYLLSSWVRELIMRAREYE